MAENAVEAANSQHTVLPTQSMGAALVVRLAEQINAIDAEVADVDAQITDLFRQHESADVLLSVPGFGPVLAATFLANIGGNLDGFDSVDRLASVAGLTPVPRDSGRISGNLHRPPSPGPGSPRPWLPGPVPGPCVNAVIVLDVVEFPDLDEQQFRGTLGHDEVADQSDRPVQPGLVRLLLVCGYVVE